jgi:hypothetical protein
VRENLAYRGALKDDGDQLHLAAAVGAPDKIIAKR